MSNEHVEKIPPLNDFLDEVFEDTNAFVQDITSSINLMPLAAVGSFALSIVAYWVYFHLLVPSGLERASGIIAAIVCFIYVGVIIMKRYYNFKRKYSRLFKLREEWEAIKGKE